MRHIRVGNVKVFAMQAGLQNEDSQVSLRHLWDPETNEIINDPKSNVKRKDDAYEEFTNCYFLGRVGHR